MDSKFYIPEIEEFCVGFEYESCHNREKRWYTEISDGSEISFIKDYYLPKGEIRVKYLDQQDIEELGWNTLRSNINWVRATKNSTEIIFEKNIEVPIIQIFKNMNCVFTGTIKNKAELKKLMQQLQIN